MMLCRYLVIKKAWPSCMRTLSGDHERFETTYFKVYAGYYFTGDGCRRDKDGYYWLIGVLLHPAFTALSRILANRLKAQASMKTWSWHPGGLQLTVDIVTYA